MQVADRLAHYPCPRLVAPLDLRLVGFAYDVAPGETGAALAAALAANKPAVIHVKVDPQALSALRKGLLRKA